MAVPRKRQSLKSLTRRYKNYTSKLNFSHRVCYGCKKPNLIRYCNDCVLKIKKTYF